MGQPRRRRRSPADRQAEVNAQIERVAHEMWDLTHPDRPKWLRLHEATRELWRGYVRTLIASDVIRLPPAPDVEPPMEGQFTIDQMLCKHEWSFGEDACEHCGASFIALHGDAT